MTHIQNTNSQYNLPPLTKKLSYASNREDPELIGRFPFESVRRSIQSDLRMIDVLDEEIRELELYLTRHAKVDDPQTYHLLKTVPGIGPILALILLYEIHDVTRFPEVSNFASYARLVRCEHESAGKVKGFGGKKIGNGHLRWALGEAACLMLRCHEPAKRWLARKEKKVGKPTALGILTAKVGRTVYQLWRKQVAFDGKKFLTS
jgi:transposase